MKDRILVYIALAISLTALTYAGWVHSQAASIADATLRRRERAFVEALTPRVQQAYQGMGITTQIDHPTTLEQLLGPYLDTMNRMITPVTGGGGNTR